MKVKSKIKKKIKKIVKKVSKKPTIKKIVKKINKKVSYKNKKIASKKVKTLSKKIKKIVKREVKTKIKSAKKNVSNVKKTALKKVEETATLTAKEIKDIEKHLLALRKEILERIKNKKQEEMPEAEVGDEADQASQSLDKEVLFELNGNSHELLDQIEAALRRISKGIYGTCEYCRRQIPKKRILALPFARYCIHCQTSNEGINKK